MGCFTLCEMDYLLTYQLGLDKPSGKAANLGNVCHKVVEIFANEKLCLQNNQTTFLEKEKGKIFTVGQISVEDALDYGWNCYLLPSFTNSDKITCRKMIDDFMGGPYNPHKNEVIMPELFFDLEIPGDWATYDYVDPHTKEPFSGRLAIRGAMDLLYKPMPGVSLYCDLKTGRKWDWAAGKPKDFNSLMHDHQMLLYYYALRRLYPNDVVLMTIHYLRADGPTTLPYGDEQYEEAYRLLKSMFLKIKASGPKHRVMEDPVKARSICKSFCHYGKSYQPGTDKTICDYMWGQLQELGTEKLTEKFGKPNLSKIYSAGGGQSQRNIG